MIRHCTQQQESNVFAVANGAHCINFLEKWGSHSYNVQMSSDNAIKLKSIMFNLCICIHKNQTCVVLLSSLSSIQFLHSHLQLDLWVLLCRMSVTMTRQAATAAQVMTST